MKLSNTQKVLVVLGALVMSFIAEASINVFAEGAACGKVSGTTILENLNAGRIHFDSHYSPNSDANKVAPLGILGLGSGLAPSSRDYAACSVKASAPSTTFESSQYRLEGYAWNDNLGFVSFYCGVDKKNPSKDHDGTNATTPVTCGDYQYETKIGKEDGGGNRKLSGYAWNESFGWISMSSAAGDVVTYGVTRAKDGQLSGYAYTETGIYINFSGAKVELLDLGIAEGGVKEGVLGGDGATETHPCKNEAFACLEVNLGAGDGGKTTGGTVNTGKLGDPPKANSISAGGLDGVRVADGKEHFTIDLYLKKADGSPIVTAELLDYNYSPVKFTWSDTVKLNQLSGQNANGALSTTSNALALEGAISYKPIEVDLVADFMEVVGEPGHYRLKKTISSYAPTLNYSFTTGTEPILPFDNEVFLDALGHPDGGTLNSSSVEKNQLTLKSIDFTMTDKSDGSVIAKSGVLFPNLKSEVSLNFIPAKEFRIYANSLKDAIEMQRGIPINFKMWTLNHGGLIATSGSVNTYLSYDKTTTACDGTDVSNFDIHFLNALDGSSVESKPKKLSTVLNSLDNGVEVKVEATLPPVQEGQKACDIISGPTLFSEIYYTVDGHDVKYYSGRIPRTVSQNISTDATILGHVYAPKAYKPTSKGDAVEEVGSRSTSKIRDAIYRTVVTKLEQDVPNNVGSASNVCTITELDGTLGTSIASGECSGLRKSIIGGENVLYFENTQVVLNLGANIKGKNVVVVENQNLFIDGDIRNPNDPSASLAIVVLRPYSAGCKIGNFYVHPDVKNVRAGIYADCSGFSYSGNKAEIDANSGRPTWASSSARAAILNKQIFLEGNIASQNTYGGADSDSEGYIRSPFEVVKVKDISSDKRAVIQEYDINFWRMTKPTFEIKDGWVVDQDCGIPLTTKMQMQIKAREKWVVADNDYQADLLMGGAVGIPDPGPDPGEVKGPDGMCNGIDAADLLPLIDPAVMAVGLDPKKDTNPVHIYYVPSKSFIFTQK